MPQCVLCRMAVRGGPSLKMRVLGTRAVGRGGFRRLGAVRGLTGSRVLSNIGPGRDKIGDIPPRPPPIDDSAAYLDQVAQTAIRRMAAALEPTAVEDPKEAINFEAKQLLQIHYRNFTERELWIGHNYMVKRTKEEARNREALRVLTGQEPKKRIPRFVAPFVPLALKAVELDVRKIEEEIFCINQDRGFRTQRMWVRCLLDAGRTPDAVEKQYLAGRGRIWSSKLYTGVHVNYVSVTAMSHEETNKLFEYLLIYRRMPRVAALIMQGLAPHIIPDVLGMVYHIWVDQMLQRDERGMTAQVSLDYEAAGVKCAEHLETMYLRRKRNPIYCVQQTMFKISKALPRDKISDFYWKLWTIHANRQYAINHPTSHSFIEQLASHDLREARSRWKEAFLIMKDMRARGDLRITNHAKRNIFAILKHSLRSHEVAPVQEILRFISALKLDPGTQLFNNLLAEASRTGDRSGLEYYHAAMVKAGYSPDMVSLTILHGYYKRAGDDESQKKIINQAFLPEQTLNKMLVTDAIHAMVMKRHPYGDVLRVYCRYFRPELLERAGMMPVDTSKSIIPPEDPLVDDLWEPDHVTFNVMVMSFCQHADMEKIMQLYKLYTKMAYHPHSLADRKLVRIFWLGGEQLVNILMVGLGKERGGLPAVAGVLDDMLQKGSMTPPSVISWSIFVKTLCLAGKVDEAKGVIEMMKTRDIKPNIITYTSVLKGFVNDSRFADAEEWLMEIAQAGVHANDQTWLFLIKGYMEARDFYAAGDAWRRMTEAGVEPSQYTISLLTYLNEQEEYQFNEGYRGEGRDPVFAGSNVSYPVLKTEEERFKEETEQLRRAERMAFGTPGGRADEGGFFEEGELEYPQLDDAPRKRQGGYFNRSPTPVIQEDSGAYGALSWEERYEALEKAEKKVLEEQEAQTASMLRGSETDTPKDVTVKDDPDDGEWKLHTALGSDEEDTKARMRMFKPSRSISRYSFEAPEESEGYSITRKGRGSNITKIQPGAEREPEPEEKTGIRVNRFKVNRPDREVKDPKEYTSNPTGADETFLAERGASNSQDPETKAWQDVVHAEYRAVEKLRVLEQERVGALEKVMEESDAERMAKKKTAPFSITQYSNPRKPTREWMSAAIRPVYYDPPKQNLIERKKWLEKLAWMRNERLEQARKPEEYVKLEATTPMGSGAMDDPEINELKKDITFSHAVIYRWSREIAAIRIFRMFRERVKDVEKRKAAMLEEMEKRSMEAKIRQVETRRLEYPSALSDVPGADVKIRKLYPNEEKIAAKKSEPLGITETQPLEPEAQPLETEAQPLESETQALEPETQPLELEAQPFDPQTQPLEPEAQSTYERNLNEEHTYWGHIYDELMRHRRPKQRRNIRQRMDQQRRNSFEVWTEVFHIDESRLEQYWKFEQICIWSIEAKKKGWKQPRDWQKTWRSHGFWKVIENNPILESVYGNRFPPPPEYEEFKWDAENDGFRKTTEEEEKQRSKDELIRDLGAPYREQVEHLLARDDAVSITQNLPDRVYPESESYQELVDKLPEITKTLEKNVKHNMTELGEEGGRVLGEKMEEQAVKSATKFPDPGGWFPEEASEEGGEMPVGPKKEGGKRRAEGEAEAEDGKRE